MLTLMSYYLGGEHLASKHKANCSVSFPGTFEQECEGYDMHIDCVNIIYFKYRY